MKPENQEAYSAATRRFILFYSISLVLVVGICYLLFSMPSRLLKEENDQLKVTLEAQEKLLSKYDAMNGSLKNIQATDQTLATTSDEMAKAGQLKQVREQENTMQTTLFEIKRDSMMMVAEINKRLTRNIVNSFDAVLTYRNTIGLLRDNISKNGNSTAEIERLTNELRSANDRLALLSAVQSSRPAPAPAPVAAAPKEKEAGGVPESVVTDLRQQVELANARCEMVRANEVRQKSRPEREQLYRSAIAKLQKVALGNGSAETKNEAQNLLTEANTKLRRASSSDL